MEEIVNKVASSSLVTLDLKDFIDLETEVVSIDLKEQLFQEMILRESDFRSYIKNEDWSKYKGVYVLIFCSADAIIPTWVYMLLASSLEPYAKKVVLGSRDRLTEILFLEELSKVDIQQYSGAKVVLKGCGDFFIPPSCYSALTTLLKPVVSSIMFGEPCSTVPVYKNRGRS